MHDDNFYVTTADDESTRHGLIEAMRRAVKGFSYGSDSERSETYGVIQKFIDQQAALKHEPLTRAYEQQLVREIFGKIEGNDPRKKRHLTVIGEDSPTLPELYNTTTIIPKTILEDNRQVSLIAARPSQANDKWLADRVGLFAMTRNGVATQIATISSQFMRVEYQDDIALTSDQHEQVVRDLLFTSIARPALKNIESSEKEHYNSKNLNGTGQQIAKYLFKSGALGEYEQYTGSDGYHRSEVNLSGEVAQKLNDFFMYPDRDYSPYPGSSPLSLALSRLEVLRAGDLRVLSILKVGERFDRLLGEARKCDEMLMCYVAKLALEEQGLQAEFDDEQIGKTKAAAVIAAKVDVNDGVHELQISGRPVSMPDEDLKPLIGVPIEQTKPFLGQEKGIGNGFSKPNVNEIIGILSRLSVAQKMQ